MHYGNIVEIEGTKTKSEKNIKTLNLSVFKKKYKRFKNFQNWTKSKRKEGEKLFGYLRKHNPIYIQKSKDWIKKFDKDSKIGQHIIMKNTSNSISLRSLKGRECIFIVTYNKGYNNGFMVLPID